jgi:hypothetical protein
MGDQLTQVKYRDGMANQKKNKDAPPATRQGYNDTQQKPGSRLAPNAMKGRVTGNKNTLGKRVTPEKPVGMKGGTVGTSGGKKAVEGLNVRGKGPWAGMNSKAQTPRAPRATGKPRGR